MPAAPTSVLKVSRPLPDRITWLGHATVLLELSGVRLLTDPVLRRRLWHLVRVAEPVDSALVERLDAILISHLHQDHFDPPSLRRVSRETHLVAPRGAGALARRLGFRLVTELSAGEEIRIGSVGVTAVPARHDGRRPPLGPTADAVGYMVSGRSRVYFVGDTDLFEEMAELAPGLDAALLPVWGWGPTLGDGHLDPKCAARCLPLLRPRLAVPIHWGTLFPVGLSRVFARRLEEPPLDFERHAATLAPEVEVRVLAPGEATIVSCAAGDRPAQVGRVSIRSRS
jgi:L-ascorbate metabolism protein UlaG (beta-lactamase superfamily)